MIQEFKTHYNQNTFDYDSGEKNSGEIKTVPDMSLSVQDIIKNYTSLQNKFEPPIYSGDHVIRNYDLEDYFYSRLNIEKLQNDLKNIDL